MFSALPYKTRQFFYLLIKLSIVGGACYFIYNKLANNDNLNFGVFWHFLTEKDVFSLKNVSFLIILSIFNWFFEILKWQNLAQIVKKISFVQSAKESLASLTASIFTPNRLGEYAAKIAYYKKGTRRKIILLNLLSNMAQMSMTVLFGLIGLYFFSSKYGLDIPAFRLARLLAIGFLLALFMLLSIRQNRYKIKGIPLHQFREFLRTIPGTKFIAVWTFALVRYAIFSFQFYWLLIIFGIDVSYTNAMMLITTMYLLSSVIPSIFVFDVLIKGSIALYLFDIVGVNNLTVLSTITVMWILNVVLPSIFGSFFVLSYRRLHKMVPAS